MQRIVWWLLVVVSATFLALTLVGAGFAVVGRMLDLDVLGAGWAFVALVTGVLFWRWILLGAWLRLRPPEGVDPSVVDPVGPWGVVGRVMIAALVVGFLGVVVWVAVVGSAATDRAEEVRDAAVRIARDRGMTVADVTAAQNAYVLEASSGDVDEDASDVYADLFDIPGARVVAVAVNGDEASILLRTEKSPPCAVVDIVRNDLIRGRITDKC